MKFILTDHRGDPLVEPYQFTVQCNPSYPFWTKDHDALIVEAWQWMKDNLGQREPNSLNYVINTRSFWFTNQDDAFKFRLRWC